MFDPEDKSEAALKEAIESGHLAGCALDVYEEEPPSTDNPLFNLPKHVAFTPHLGASTAEAQENVGIQVAEQIRDFLATGEIRNAINMPSLDAAALAEVGPYLDLAHALGKLLAKLGMHPQRPDRDLPAPPAEADKPLEPQLASSPSRTRIGRNATKVPARTQRPASIKGMLIYHAISAECGRILI